MTPQAGEGRAAPPPMMDERNQQEETHRKLRHTLREETDDPPIHLNGIMNVEVETQAGPERRSKYGEKGSSRSPSQQYRSYIQDLTDAFSLQPLSLLPPMMAAFDEGLATGDGTQGVSHNFLFSLQQLGLNPYIFVGFLFFCVQLIFFRLRSAIGEAKSTAVSPSWSWATNV